MEQDNYGIIIYMPASSSTPRTAAITYLDIDRKPFTPPPSSCTTSLCLTQAPKKPGSKRRAMAKGIQDTMSKTLMLINFLPTGTLLTFEMLLPSVSKNGECTHVTT
ncbi:Protein DMP8 [Linum perenne]